MIIDICVPSILGHALSYEGLDSSSAIGMLVEVELRRQKVMGFVKSIPPFERSFKNGFIKPIIQDLGECLPSAFVNFLERFCEYTLTPIGLITKHSLLDLEDYLKAKVVPTSFDYSPPQLNASQASSAEQIIKSLGSFDRFCLDGVTGSGKTEVYLDAVAKVWQNGQQALILLPEIALTSQFTKRFEERFGRLPLVWHSQTTPKQKRDIWKTVLSKEPTIVVGARSALFLPFSKLGLIIVDEEHDSSYKQEDVITYHARDMAVLRAQQENIPIVLATATPSLETFYNSQESRYKILKLNDRFGAAQFPTMHVLDMRQQNIEGYLHSQLHQHMQQTLESGKQVLLFLNRRGYAPLSLCRCCGYRANCPNCDISLVLHKRDQKLHCHYCDYQQLPLTRCPKCQSDNIMAYGPGIEKLAEDIQQRFPDYPPLLITSDYANTPKKMSEILSQIHNKEAQLILATQIFSKGFHFPDITCVGVVDADLGLHAPDLRATERTYQQLHQVAGRAGRGENPGHVYIQTYDPDHRIFQSLRNSDRDAHMSQELQERELHLMPPFGGLTALILTDTDNERVFTYAQKLTQSAPRYADLLLLGPIPAPLARVNNKFRWRFLLKYPKKFPIQRYLHQWLLSVEKPAALRLSVDVDPVSFH